MTYAEERIRDEIKQRILEEPYVALTEVGGVKVSEGDELEFVLPRTLYDAMAAGLDKGYKLRITELCFKLRSEIERAGYALKE